MKINVPPRVVHTVLLCVFLLLHISPARAQWVRKTDALKKRSEVTSVVYNNKLYCFIGFGDSSLDVEPTSEVYDPATGTWSLLASMPSGKTVTHQGAALVDNTVWHVGGRVGKAPGPLTSEIWIYNITTNSWSPGPQLRDPATGNLLFWGGGGAVLLGRTLHVFGGFAVDACNNDQDRFHLTLDIDTWLSNPTGPVQWQNTRKPLPVKRNHFSTTVLNGRIYVLGGQFGHDCGGGEDKQYSHVYDPIANTWTELTTMPTPRSHAEGGIFPLDGKIYLVSGQGSNGASTNKVTIFNPEANNGLGSWTDDASMVLPNGYEGASAKVVNSTFIVSHGGIGASTNPTNLTYSRTVTRNIAYKLGFTAGCLNLKASTASTIKAKNLLYTTEGTKNFITSSNANWLTVTKNATGTALNSATDIEVTINTAGLAPGNYTGIVTATPSGSGPTYSGASFCVNLTVEGQAPEINAPLELIFSGVKGTSSAAQSLIIHNTGAGALQVSALGFTGTHAAAFGLVDAPTTPLTIPSGQSVALKVIFKPGNTTTGNLSAALQINNNDADEGTLKVNLYGLSTNGLYGNLEPTLDAIVKTLGYNINVGSTGLILGTSPSPIGDEVLVPLFKKAGTGPVNLKPVARYSPDDLLDFGYYTKNNGIAILNKVATIDLKQDQTLNPKIVSGGATSFDPGSATFGFYTGSTSYASHINYTEDGLNNKGPLAHAVRIYPLKNRLGQVIANSYLLGFEPAVNGDYQDYVFVVSNVMPATVPVPVTKVVHINSGGVAFTASGNRQFVADTYFGGTDRTFSIPSGDILNTTDDVLYRTERSASSFNYTIPVTNGSYNVVLHFAEIWFGAPGGGTGGAGKRQFHVDVEGGRKLTNYDIFAAAGGAMRAIQVSLPVQVSDGTLNINFLTGAANMPKVSAIEVLTATSNRAPVLATIGNKTVTVGQTLSLTATATDADAGQTKTFSLIGASQGATINATTGVFSWTPSQSGSYTFTLKVTDNGSPALSDEETITVIVNSLSATSLRINSGGVSFTASGNRQFIADNYFGGTTSAFSIPSGDIFNTTDDALYYTERYAPSFAYNIPVTNGSHNVVLHFAEIWFGAPGGSAGGVGKRQFHVDVEGGRKLTNYDIFAAAGGAMRAIQVSLPVTVSDGTLNINFLTGAANMPKVSAIEVLSSTGSIAKVDMATADEGKEGFNLHPNPAHREFTLAYYSLHTQQVVVNIYDARSKVVVQQKAILESGHNLINLSTEKMAAGMYLIQVSSEKQTKVKKLMVTH